jgi:putative nucleotidyltransferase with HDIG domain
MRLWHSIRKPRNDDDVETPQGGEPTFEEALLLPRPSDVLWRWAQEGQIADLMPDLEALRGVPQLPAHRDDAFIHTLKVVDAIEPLPRRRWAALLHDIGKGPTFIETPEGRSRFFEHDRIGAEMVPDILADFIEDEQEVERVQRLVRLHMRPISYNSEWTDTAVRRLIEECAELPGPDLWDDLLALAHADLRGYRPEPIDRGLWTLEQLQAHRDRLLAEDAALASIPREPYSPLDGNDLMRLTNRPPGPWITDLKAYLTEEVAAGRLAQDDRVRAEEVAREWLRSVQ